MWVSDSAWHSMMSRASRPAQVPHFDNIAHYITVTVYHWGTNVENEPLWHERECLLSFKKTNPIMNSLLCLSLFLYMCKMIGSLLWHCAMDIFQPFDHVERIPSFSVYGALIFTQIHWPGQSFLFHFLFFFSSLLNTERGETGAN